MTIQAVPDLVNTLRESGVLEPGQQDEVERTLQPQFQDPKQLAAALVHRNWLTSFQAEQLLAGNARDLVFGKYVLLKPLGAGGMGQVYKARHRLMKREVALKVVRPDRFANPTALQRFVREIEAASQLLHPNVVIAHDAEKHGDVYYFVMEYLEGRDLDQLVKRGGPLAVPSACEYIRQAALGLQHAHERGLVHRDIKPSNLFLTYTSAPEPTPVVKILDMGLARLRDPGAIDPHAMTKEDPLTKEGMVMGTPDYMSPEQASDSRSVDIRSDLYSLGCTLYFLLTGSVPFPEGGFMEKLARHLWHPPRPIPELRPDVPPAVVDIVAKLMAKKREDRFQTPAELAAALAPYSDPRMPLTMELVSGPAVHFPPATASLGEDLTANLPAGISKTPLDPPAGQSGFAADSLQGTAQWRPTGETQSVGGPRQPTVEKSGFEVHRPPEPSPQERGVKVRRPTPLAPGGPGMPTGSPSQTAPLSAAESFQVHLPSEPPARGPDWQTKSPGDTAPMSALESETAPYTSLPQRRRGLLLVTGVVVVLLAAGGLAITQLPAFRQDAALVNRSPEQRQPGTELQGAGRPQAIENGPAATVRPTDAPGAAPKEPEKRAAANAGPPPEKEREKAADAQVIPKKETPRVAPEVKPADKPEKAAPPVSPPSTKTVQLGSLYTFPERKSDFRQVVFTEDASQALFCRDGIVQFFDLDNPDPEGRSLLEKRYTEPSSAENLPLQSLAVAPDGQRVFFGSHVIFGEDGQPRRSPVLGFWQLVKREARLVTYQRYPQAAVTALSVSPTGVRILSGHENGDVCMWDLKGEKLTPPRVMPKKHTGAIRCLVFSPNGERALSGGRDGTVWVWDVEKRTALRAFQMHGGFVTGVAFSEDGQLAVSGARSDKTVRVWQVETAREQVHFVFQEWVLAVAITPDSSRAVAGLQDGTVWSMDLASKKRSQAPAHHKNQILAVTVSPDGQYILSASEDMICRSQLPAATKQP
jgi:eukaryotic-like serine/threonine-protein kinase